METELYKLYRNRLIQVLDYIKLNIDQQISLDELARIAHFSPFHFHRIFKFITQETPNAYILRRRIEKAAAEILHSNKSIQEIGLEVGFNDASSFSRSFKKYYQLSPTAFKKANPFKFSKIRQLKSKIGQEYPKREEYLRNLNHLMNWRTMNAKIEVQKLSKFNFAYHPIVGPQNIRMAIEKVMQWARPQALFHEKSKMITQFHDSFKITEADKVRMSVGMLVEVDAIESEAVKIKTLSPSKCIVGKYEIGLNEFEKAWTGLFAWMNEKGYSKSEIDPFEIYHNDFNEHPEKKCIVDLCIPIQ